MSGLSSLSDLEKLFESAAALDGAGRVDFLDGACQGRPEMRTALERLLAAHDSPSPLLEPGEGSADLSIAAPRIGPYRLLERLGEGGCGVVYLAEQTEPMRRMVALKVIKWGMDTRSVVARFEAERQALALMDHPNIARVFDGGATETGRPFFVMELARGVRITDYCDQNCLSIKERLELFIKVCQAIQHAHQKGVIHRDIKPSNILVTRHDGGAEPKVIDFGIAKAIEGRLTEHTVFTQLHQFIGTPAYMSPKQAEMSGLDIDTRSDIYSLGVLLYELLAGHTPFDAKELIASGVESMCKTIREKDPLRPNAKLAALSRDKLTATAMRRSVEPQKLIHLLRGDLDWIVMKCLEKNRARRYDTPNSLAMDIQRHLNHEPVLARPAGAAYKLQKAFRRNRLVFTASAAVAIALLAGILVSTRQTRLALRAQEQARHLLYDSDINLTQQAFALNNVGKARRLLDRHRPRPGEEDPRGWEWRYLWQLTRSGALATLTHRSTRGTSVSFSPDGRRLAVGWFDGHVDLWDVPERRLSRALTTNDSSEQHGLVAFSPTRNLLAATAESGLVRLYDFDTGAESVLWRRPDTNQWIVRDLSFSPDGSRVVIYSAPQPDLTDVAAIVNTASGTMEYRLTTDYYSGIFHGRARLSADNRRLFFGGGDFTGYTSTVECFDLARQTLLWRTQPSRDLGVTALDVSPDGRLAASASGFEDTVIRVWDAATGHLVKEISGNGGWVCALRFSADGRNLISAGTDQSVRIWDANTGDLITTLRGHTDEVHAAVFSAAAHLFASTGKDGNLILWDEKRKRSLDGYYPIARDCDLRLLDGSRLLQLQNGRPPIASEIEKPTNGIPLAEIGDCTDLLLYSGGNMLCYWNRGNQAIISELRGTNLIQKNAVTLNSPQCPASFGYNSRHQLAAWTWQNISNTIFIENLTGPRRHREIKADISEPRVDSFSEDGQFIFCRREPLASLRVWKVDTGELVLAIEDPLNAALFVPDGDILAAIVKRNNDHEVRFYDLTQPNRPPRCIPGKEYSGFLAASPDGSLVASSTDQGLIRLFDPKKGELLATLQGCLHAVNALAFSADGRRLVSASSGGSELFKLWDVATRQELLTLSGRGPNMYFASWSPDQNTILIGQPWQAWRVPSWEEIAAAEARDKATP